MKKYIPVILLLAVGIPGLLVLLYPALSNCRNVYQQSQLIAEYREKAEAMQQEEWDAMFAAAGEYNRRLLELDLDFACIGGDNAALMEVDGMDYEEILNVDGAGSMGYLLIDKIGVKLAIGHGTGEEVLEEGVGHLEGSSMPVGGSGTHAALFGHRGLSAAKLFTDLDQMEIGDTFEVHVLNRKLKYEVDQILVVEPTETDALLITGGEDYVTLVTCTPYAVNSHRLLVRGRRMQE